MEIDVARLKLLKSNHQNNQYRLEDNLLKYFPENIERNNGYIRGFEQDMATLATNMPPKEDIFAPMEILGVKYLDKEKAGAAILEACKAVKDNEPVEVGRYKGFMLSLSFESFCSQYKMTAKGAMSHTAELGTDARNITRIDNVLDAMPQRLQAVQAQLDNLYQQTKAAKAELGKTFPQEQELKEKSSRLAILDTELNMDTGVSGECAEQQERSESIGKRERLSVLDSLKTPSKYGTVMDKKHDRNMEVER